MGLLRKLGSVFDWLVDSLAYSTGAIFIFIMIAVTVDVSSRKLLGVPIQWVDEVTGYLLLYVTFLSATWLLKREGHVSVDVVVERLNQKTRVWLNLIISILIGALCLIMTCSGVFATLNVYRRGVFTVTTLEVPLALLVAVIPLGFFLLFIQFLRRAYWCQEILQGRRKALKEGHEEF
jgi:TRAP-type C4-dicarboxylate transport system permease small subunit